MIDPIDTTASTATAFDRILSDPSEQLEQIARDVDTSPFLVNPGSAALGLVFASMILLCGFFLSRTYSNIEREELAEAEQNRLAEEKQKIQRMETYRSKIAKIIESYAVHLTNMNIRSSSSVTSSRHNSIAIDVSGRIIGKQNRDKRKILNGDKDENDEVPIETITITSDDSTVEEDIGDIEEARSNESDENDRTKLESGNEDEKVCVSLPSTLTVDLEDQARDDDEEAPRIKPSPSSSSLSSTCSTTIRANLRAAVIGDPCSICLEPFKAGDDIVYCSNTMQGKKPHIFHKACSLDYVLAHTDGIHAPCPCCRKHLLPSEEEQQKKGCFRNSHSSVLTLPGFG